MSDGTKLTWLFAGAILIIAGRLWMKRHRAARLADELLEQVLSEKDGFRR
ncbi:MAG TPA: hypothetical protein VFA38_03240 [Nitrospirales bacterium]|nr:hypothetical protein [Nitrospirales bacterium]